MERSGAWSNLRMPITLAYVSSVLKRDGHEVLLTDDIAMHYLKHPINMERVMESFQPELVVINTSMPTVFTEDMEAAKIIKKNDHNVLTVMIGVAPTLVPQPIVETGYVDIAVRCEPELIIRKICASKNNWRRTEGITFRYKGKVISNPDAIPLKDLDQLPMPDFDSLPLDAYRTPVDRARQVLIDVSRGCPHQCIYCTGTKFYGRRFRCRRPEKVVEEMEYVKKLGVKKVLFWADTFTYDHTFVRGLCSEIIEHGLEQEMSWVVNSRVDRAEPDIIKYMKEAGCFLIAFGVESGVQEILNYVKKGITLNQTRSAFKWMREAELPSAAHVVFGLAPFENERTIRKTLKFVREIDPNYANFHVATPYPNTELYRRYKEGGYIINEDFSRLESNRANISLPELTDAQLEYWRDRAFREFYITPRMLVQELKHIRSSSELRNLVDNAFWFVKGWMRIRQLTTG